MSNKEDEIINIKTLIFISILVLLIGAWMSISTMDVVAHAEGKVIPSDFIKTIQNLEGGIITQINIKNGDKVKKGDLLFRLNSIQYNSEFESTRKIIYSLQIRANRLLAEINNTQPNFNMGLSKSVPDIIQSEMAEYKVRQEKIVQLKQFIILAEKEFNMIKNLTKEGLEPQNELIKAERYLAEKNQALREQKENAISEYNRIMNEIRSKEDGLVTLGDKVKRTDVISTTDGLVSRIFVTTVGGVVKPGDVLAEIVPQEDVLVIEAKLKPSDVAVVKPSMNAKVKITAFDYSIYGIFDAKVLSISADSINNEKGESYYNVRLTSSDKVFDSTGKVLKIQTGMMAQVDIVTEQRTFLEYIFKPLKQISSTSFKER